MYETIDDEVFLAPESIIAGIVAASAFNDGSEWLALAPAGDASFDAIADGDDAIAGAPTTGADEPPRPARSTAAIDAWSRHARGANGFGG